MQLIWPVDVAVNMDHSSSFDVIERALELGFTSVRTTVLLIHMKIMGGNRRAYELARRRCFS